MQSKASAKEHPSLCAWREVYPSAGVPRSISVLKEHPKSNVYRLCGSAPGGGNLIAKRTEAETAQIEHRIYDEILKHLNVRTPNYYGSLEENDFWWLFLEDCGAEDYDGISHEPKALARTVAIIHSEAAKFRDSVKLPDRTASYYHTRLESARAEIEQNIGNSVFTAEDRTILSEVRDFLELLDGRWRDAVIGHCGSMNTLVHGDLRPKNLRRRGADVFLLDWEYGGWGSPAADLAFVDSNAYYDVLPQASRSLKDVLVLSRIGTLFQWISAVDWASMSLNSGLRSRHIRYMHDYAGQIGSLDLDLGFL